eukprot:8921070-Ditylum_brightwellii.AAC.1
MNLPGNSEIREFMDQLTTSTDVSQHMELPMIVVIGDAGSGKSSLLSSILMLELMDNTYFTTSCPIQLHMSKSDKKQAAVGVRWNQRPSAAETTAPVYFESINRCAATPLSSFSANVQSPVKEVSNSASSPDSEYFPSASKPLARRIFSFGKVAPEFPEMVITEDEWHLLPEIISKAQKHIVDFSGNKISRHVVTVKISGPEYYDLTLVDLPCVVPSREINEMGTVDDINCLVKDYLENNKGCVILAVFPANEDFRDSQIMAEVLKVDPETRRTIP